MLTLSERVSILEKFLLQSVPGTTFSRVLGEKEKSGVIWCLSIGELMGPKEFFHGNTMEAALTAAENHYFPIVDFNEDTAFPLFC